MLSYAQTFNTDPRSKWTEAYDTWHMVVKVHIHWFMFPFPLHCGKAEWAPQLRLRLRASVHWARGQPTEAGQGTLMLYCVSAELL